MLHLVASLLLSQSGPLTVASSSPSGACIINSNGCVTDGPGSYGNNERCTITTSVAVTLNSVGTFATESGYDYLTIGGTRYQGASGPSGVALPAGSSFTWTSDSSVANVGYVICATAAVAAGAPPQAPILSPPPPYPSPPPPHPPPPRPPLPAGQLFLVLSGEQY